MPIRVVLTAWIPRGVEEDLGPVTVLVRRDPGADRRSSRECQVALRGQRRPAPDSRAGAFATVTFDDDSGASDRALGAVAVETAVLALNRVIHVAAFAGRNRKVLPVVEGRDLEDMAIAVMDASSTRPVNAPGTFARSPRIKGRGLTAKVQAVLARTNVSDPNIAEALWLDALEAVFDDRPREALVLSRACVEVAWEACARAVLAARAQVWPQDAVRCVHALLTHALGAALKDRLDAHSELLLGFSFQTAWTGERWGRLNNAIKARNEAAHGPADADIEDARRAVEIVRDVLDELAALHP